jgi:hypothetical protein
MNVTIQPALSAEYAQIATAYAPSVIKTAIAFENEPPAKKRYGSAFRIPIRN